MDLCSSARPIRPPLPRMSARWPGASATTPFTSTAFPVGSKLAKSAPWTTGTGNSKNTDIKASQLRTHPYLFTLLRPTDLHASHRGQIKKENY
ncbi:RING-box protein 1A [Caligus rogercresseyi]|uniref:RING-box protein 1A n=1 Tax=Caligus rogercresseyi TaxID=217165 RepID=A0A7T8KGY4_CALRO|nr:RING-box protein 1A [Caligus rogercresseyi]